MKRLKRTPGQTDVRLNSSTRQLASDPRSQTAEPQNNKCDVAASCPHSILVKRLECCADRLNPPPKAGVGRREYLFDLARIIRTAEWARPRRRETNPRRRLPLIFSPVCALIGHMETTPQAEHFDVLIVGAGLSGIGAGYHLQQKCRSKRFIILEGRDCIGGTWDLFRYPGIRSDSDMFTLGYSFKPWTDPKAIADGPSILNYVRQTATENGIDKKIRYRQ